MKRLFFKKIRMARQDSIQQTNTMYLIQRNRTHTLLHNCEKLFAQIRSEDEKLWKVQAYMKIKKLNGNNQELLTDIINSRSSFYPFNRTNELIRNKFMRK